VRPSCCDPRGVLGNSETRNLEFGSPSPLPWTEEARGGLGNSETRNLEFGPSLGLGPKRGPRKLGNSESGICPGVSWNLHTRNLGIWNLQRSILESAHEETWNLDFGIPLRTSHGGAQETRKLGIWNLQRSILESAHLETWNLDFGVPLQTHGGAPETRKLGIWNLLFRIWKNLGFRAARLPPPLPPPRALGDRSSLPGGSPPWSTVGQPLFVNGHIMIVHVYLDTVNFGITRNLEKFCVRVQDAIVTEIRSTKNDHLCHYFPIVPSLTIAYVDSQRTQRYTRHRRMTTVSSDSGQVAQVVALVQQPVKAPTAPATADSAPVPAGLAGAAQIQSCGSGCAACPSQLRR
jgi:hypothetical protein